MKFLTSLQILVLAFIISHDAKAKNQIVADLSQENVKITTDFLGAKILLYGAYDLSLIHI